MQSSQGAKTDGAGSLLVSMSKSEGRKQRSECRMMQSSPCVVVRVEGSEWYRWVVCFRSGRRAEQYRSAREAVVLRAQSTIGASHLRPLYGLPIVPQYRVCRIYTVRGSLPEGEEPRTTYYSRRVSASLTLAEADDTLRRTSQVDTSRELGDGDRLPCHIVLDSKYQLPREAEDLDTSACREAHLGGRRTWVGLQFASYFGGRLFLRLFSRLGLRCRLYFGDGEW